MNERISKVLNQISILMYKSGEPMKGRAYKKAEETILNLSNETETIEDLKGKPGIGKTILKNINEDLETGR